jgi:hypothetical protein
MTTTTATRIEPSEPEPGADDELARAYAQGDFAFLRKRARELAADPSASESLRNSSREWAARVSVDVAVYGMLAFAFVLFCAIVVRYALP